MFEKCEDEDEEEDEEEAAAVGRKRSSNSGSCIHVHVSLVQCALKILDCCVRSRLLFSEARKFKYRTFLFIVFQVDMLCSLKIEAMRNLNSKLLVVTNNK
jgi:hypothetical protein